MELGHLAFLLAAILVVAVGLDNTLIPALRRLRASAWRRRGRSPPDDAPSRSSLPLALRDWAAAHWRELAAGLVFAALLGYVLVVTPRSVIPTHALGPVERPPLAGMDRIWEFLEERRSTWIKLWPPVSAAALAGICLAGWRSGRGRQALRAGTLLAFLAVALEAQLLLLDGRLVPASIIYATVLLGWILWLVIWRPQPEKDPSPNQRMGKAEIGLLVLVLVLTVFARFYALSRIPYGIEGDESKWTIEVVSVMLDGKHTIQSEYHYTTEPVSFFMQAPFHHLLGPSILSARIAVATYSVLAGLAFYWLVRETLGPSAALLSATLLAVSPLDVSASRLALVESHVKFWAVAGLFLLARGLRTRRKLHSFLSGVTLSIGLLTYDTFAPMIGVALIWAVITLAARRASLREWLAHLTALLAPILIVTPFVVEYLLGRMQYYNAGRFAWDTAPLRVFLSNFLQVIQNFWMQTYGDFIFNRSGPIINSLLVPLLALGLVLAWGRIRRPAQALPAVWLTLLFFPVPIYAGSPYVRVFYPGLPAVYVLVSLAILLIWRETRSALPDSFRPALIGLAGLALAGVVVLNLYIHFNDLRDPTDRLIRRELADTVTEAVAPGRRIYVPYFGESGDPIQFEQSLLLLEVRRKLPRDQIPQHIWIGTYDEFLPTLSREGFYSEDLAIVVNHSVWEREQELTPILETVQRCLGARRQRDGQWFDLYVVDSFDIQAARCAAPAVDLTSAASFPVSLGQSFQFHWRMEHASGPARATFECQRLRADTVVVEAEDMEHDGGWEEDRRFVTGFRDRAYLADRLTVGGAHTTVSLRGSGTYTLWLRTFRRAPDPYPLHLSVDGNVHTLTYNSSEPVGEWVWLEAARLSLGPGDHTVHMARPVQEYIPGTLALFVDALILSGDPSFDPNRDSEWLPYFESQQDVPPSVSSGTFRYEGATTGTYRCWVTILDGERLVDRDGKVGARSDLVEFAVLPRKHDEDDSGSVPKENS